MKNILITVLIILALAIIVLLQIKSFSFLTGG